MDFTNPGAMELWARLLERFNQFNVAGYKLDCGEDVQVGIGGRFRFDFFDGSDEMTMHHRYATFYHRAYLNTLPVSSPRPKKHSSPPMWTLTLSMAFCSVEAALMGANNMYTPFGLEISTAIFIRI